MGQQHGQGQDVGGVVGQQRFQDGGVAPARVFAPQQHGHVAVGSGQIAPVDAEVFLAFFEPALDADAAQDVSQVDVGLGEFRAEVRGEHRGVEAAAVVGDQDLAGQDVAGEVVEVLAVGVGAGGVYAVVEGHGRDFVLGRAVGFDVDAGQAVLEVEEQSPGFGGRQALGEPVGVAGGQAFFGFEEFVAPHGGLGRGQGRLVGVKERVPIAGAGGPEAAFGGRPKAGQMEEGMAQHGRSCTCFAGRSQPLASVATASILHGLRRLGDFFRRVGLFIQGRSP